MASTRSERRYGSVIGGAFFGLLGRGRRGLRGVSGLGRDQFLGILHG